MTRTVPRLAVTLLVTLPLLAAAQQAYTRYGVSLRAGPGGNYPLVASLGRGQPVDVVGCTRGYGWCDVGLPDGLRGWIAAGSLDYPYDGGRVPLGMYGAAIGVPIVAFGIGSYWGNYYRDRSWYGDRRWWGSRPPPPAMGWAPPAYVRPGWQPNPWRGPAYVGPGYGGPGYVGPRPGYYGPNHGYRPGYAPGPGFVPGPGYAPRPAYAPHPGYNPGYRPGPAPGYVQAPSYNGPRQGFAPGPGFVPGPVVGQRQGFVPAPQGRAMPQAAPMQRGGGGDGGGGHGGGGNHGPGHRGG